MTTVLYLERSGSFGHKNSKLKEQHPKCSSYKDVSKKNLLVMLFPSIYMYDLMVHYICD